LLEEFIDDAQTNDAFCLAYSTDRLENNLCDEDTDLERRPIMPYRKLVLIFVTLVLLATSLWLMRESLSPPTQVSTSILEYSFDNLPVLGLTNTGRTTLQCRNSIFNGDVWLRVQTPNGWDVRTLDFIAAASLLPGMLKPGSNTCATILLPSNAIRWQLGYNVRTASLRDDVLSRLGNKWGKRLDPVCKRLFSSKEGPELEIRTEVFECPLRGRGLAGGGSRPLFSPKDLSPFGTRSQDSTPLGPNAF